MPPSKWDEEEESTSPPPVVGRRRFDDEEEDEVLDSWDAAEDSEVEREKAKKASEAKAKADAEAAAKKKSKAQRIEEHKQERRQRAADASDSDESYDEDETDRRARLRATEQDADLKHAQDLFGDIDLNRMRNRGSPKAVVVADAADPTNSVDLSAMPLFKPTTKDQFAKVTETLIPLFSAQAKKPQYAIWALEFAKQLVKELPSTEVKKIASALSTMSNEKMREERAADKGNKKSKAAKTKVTLNANRDSHMDTANYGDDDGGLGDDDFM
ncbi:eukaryotic translation initiation factor 3 subunit J [Aspergillus campestris IBT 28561]|uniref:Eukaryotic translation initiation factor 3 subunit J n=1 Tax=Aspergillus campestris (strain IBT 28561) TaxID=1392248 RepID=A0A2I1D2C0_ASPC2|nr:eukaryotic translation initiation factor 3 subunit J [Aspergillus campestris IBT 28561]PKY04033.1 eukaryotic translation initiation factor 3 subunit J [Aspergillus campestris IBT 28561]